MKKYKKFGFSLAEMMIVLMLIAVVMAASAPMITRKVSRERSDKIFDMLNVDPPNAVEYIKGRNQRIYMNSRNNGYVGIRETGESIPKNSVIFGYSTYTAGANNFVELGFNTVAATDSVVIGHNANAKGKGSVAIGKDAVARSINVSQSGTSTPKGSLYSTLVGAKSYTNADYTTAIGYNARVEAKNSTAIGYGAKTDKENTIVLGTKDDTVYIPGNLVVDHAALIGRAAGRNDNLYFRPYSYVDGRHFAVINADQWRGVGNNIAMVEDAEYPRNLHVKVGNFQTLLDSWHSDYEDNHRIKINFADPTKGDDKFYSDIRLKNVGEVFNGGLEELNKLTTYNFTFKNDEAKTPHVGIIAQDLQKVFPNAVSEDKYGYLKIRWDEMFFSVINAVKELNTKITALADKYQNISSELTNLRNTVQNQQAVIETQQSEINDLVKRIETLEKK